VWKGLDVDCATTTLSSGNPVVCAKPHVYARVIGFAGPRKHENWSKILKGRLVDAAGKMKQTARGGIPCGKRPAQSHTMHLRPTAERPSVGLNTGTESPTR
jgi:hypothetical protein